MRPGHHYQPSRPPNREEGTVSCPFFADFASEDLVGGYCIIIMEKFLCLLPRYLWLGFVPRISNFDTYLKGRQTEINSKLIR
jgi:hypothetical protein